MKALAFDTAAARKDSTLGLLKLASALVIFLAGAMLGLSLSARYFDSQAEDLFFSAAQTYASSNCDRVCLSLKPFVDPGGPVHAMTDDELFWRASMAPKRDDYPFYRVPKVAFLFLTDGPLAFVPLWERFFNGHDGLYSIYLHAPPDYELELSNSSVFYGRRIPTERIFWGSVSLVDAEKRLLANALLDFSNECFVLLSESCIPIFDFPTVYKYLMNSEHSFVESYNEDSPHGRGHYNRQMYPDIKLQDWRKGSAWFELNRELAVNLVADIKYYRIFNKYCKPSCYSDEHYIPTFVNMFFGSLIANRTVTWVNWSLGGPHPSTYGREDITEDFIQRIRNNGTICTYNSRQTSDCFLFARKFAPNALEPLLNLTSTVLKF